MAQKTPEIWRNPDGTFGKGTIANPNGRPKREVEREYLDVTISSVSPADWAEIVKMVKALAKAGDMTAVKWLSENLMGKPAQQVDMNVNDTSAKGYIGISPDEWDAEDNADER